MLQLLHFTSPKYHHSGNSLWRKTELRTLLSSDFFTTSQLLLLSLCFFDWGPMHMLSEWLADSPFWSICHKVQGTCPRYVFTCPHYVFTCWSQDLSGQGITSFPLRLRKSEVPSSKTKQILFTVFKTLIKKTRPQNQKRKSFPQMFFQLSASHFVLVTSWGIFRCLDCKTNLGSLKFFACFYTLKANTCTFGLLLTHKILPIVGLSKTCFLTDITVIFPLFDCIFACWGHEL